VDILSGTATHTNVYHLNNSANIDIHYSYYVEVFLKGNYVTTADFEVLVPANRGSTIEITTFLGKEAFQKVRDAQESGAILHNEGSLSGEGTWLFIPISKSWDIEWDSPLN
jgi:hypothetical protein